ncbi:MAG: DUF2442 domain-containing protein [Bacteroidetes bacterium]|nr:DUF2442 domain-containing protein [Bacteroidota bacterium]
MNPRITAVKANPDFTLVLTFANRQKRIFDMKPYLPIGVFRQLKKYSKFKKVKPFLGSIAWATGQDLCPDTLYLDSKRIYKTEHKESLSVAAEPKAQYRKTKRK